MSGLYDEDGVDGPFIRGMARQIVPRVALSLVVKDLGVELRRLAPYRGYKLTGVYGAAVYRRLCLLRALAGSLAILGAPETKRN